MLGEHVQQTKLEHMKAQMAIFKKSLEEFAIKHRCASRACWSCSGLCTSFHRAMPLSSPDSAKHKTFNSIVLHHIVRGTSFCRNDIRQDPVFRAQFHTMCANVGVDPLASNKGMWAQLLGFGDFYYELGVQIVEACLATRAYNGGFMELGSLRNAVQVSNPTICKCCKLPAVPAQVSSFIAECGSKQTGMFGL